MTVPFAPRLDILPEPQRRLWDELAGVPEEFTLAGGTAVALHLGHRVSVDFDFFGTEPFDPAQLFEALPFLSDSKLIQQAPNTLSCLVDRGGPVKVSFFGLPRLRLLERPHVAADNGLKVASLLDLAGMKAAVVSRRAESKDYLDLDSILRAGIGLPVALSAARLLYGPAFEPQIALKALSHFGDGDLRRLSEEIQARLLAAVAATDLDRLPVLKRQKDGDADGSPR